MNIKSIFTIRASDKHFLLALLAVVGVVFFWRGLWGVLDITPIVSNFFVSLAIGLAIMTLSGVIYREFAPEEEPLTPVLDILNAAFEKSESKRKEMVIEYHDDLMQKHKKILHTHIKSIEHNFIITERAGEEYFIPIQRIHKVISEGKVVWKTSATE